jgi:general secretion pathway protein E
MPAKMVEAEEIIRERAKFPGVVGLVSGPTQKGALAVPVHLQNDLICVKLTNGRVQIAYNPLSQAAKAPMRLMRIELADSPLDTEPGELIATAEVIRDVRLSLEQKVGANAAEIKSAAVDQFKKWVQEAKDLGATDMHLRIRGGGRADVEVRVDGELEHLADSKTGLTDESVLDVIRNAFEVLADRHSNSDGSFSDNETRSCMIDRHLGIANLRLRFASQKGHYGPKATIRLLTTEISHEPRSLESMGFAASQCRLFERAQRLEAGIILQCGVTGSGKTTVAKTFLETHPKNGCGALYQVADPVEYLIKGVHQINIQRSLLTLVEAGKKDPYQEVVESLMRMDPDGIDLGEIRDPISAGAAASVAKSGHLAMGTLHTKSIAGILNRLVDKKIGLTRDELTSSEVLGMASYQALVPLLCPVCAMDRVSAVQMARQKDQQSDARYIESVLQILETRFKVNTAGMRFRNSEPCSNCNGRGTKRLTIVAEVMMPDDKWLDLSAVGNDRGAWRHYRESYSDRDLNSENLDGKSVLEHMLLKATKGLVDPTGIERFGVLDSYEVIR